MNAVPCPRCGNVNPPNSNVCLRCSLAPLYGGPPQAQPMQQQMYQPMAPKKRGEGRKFLTAILLCGGGLFLIVIIGAAFGGSSKSKPTSDADLVTFAKGLGTQLGWPNAPVDGTSQIAKDAKPIGYASIDAPKGKVEFRRFPDVATRKAAQPAGDTAVAGCGDVLVAFGYADKEAAVPDAQTATNLLQFLNGGDCDKPATVVTTKAPDAAARPAASKTYDLALDSCVQDRFKFVTAKGQVRNNTSSTQSYYIEVELLDAAKRRIGYGNGFATAVSPGQTATWTIIGTVDYSGAVSCNYSAREL